MAGALEIARRALDELGFFSKALEEAKGAKMKEGSVQQWKNVLQKQGVKPAELDATGFNALNPSEKLDRDSVINYLTENRVKLGEKKYGENPSNPSPDALVRQARSDMDRLNDDIAREVERNGGQMNERAYELQRQYTQAEQRMWDASEQINQVAAAEPRFEGYTLPGGANYQERVLTLPGERKFAAEQHWPDVDNPLAHYRTKERLGPNGERVLHIDEIQSDWAQQGRDRGFKDPKALEKLRELQKEYSVYDQQLREITPQRMARLQELEAKVRTDLGMPARNQDMTREQGALYWPARDELVYNDPVMMDLNERFANANLERNRRNETMLELERGGANGLPTAPFVTQTKDWTDLTLKRAMIEAERGGYDAVAWTPGAEHAKRYDLGDRVQTISYHPGDGHLQIVSPDGSHLYSETEITPDKLSGIIGKDNAERLLATSQKGIWGNYHQLEPSDMTWGGEGMKAYYDKIVPDRLTKLARTLDPEARLESMPAGRRLGVESDGGPDSPARVYETTDWGAAQAGNIGTFSREFPNYGEAETFTDMAHWPRGGEIPQLPMMRLTPRMREEIQKGLPLFVGAPVVAGGALSTLNQEQAPMANEFARGGPVREQREQERWQDIERQSPSDEMLRDSAYRYYMPAYDRMLATRPIGGTDAYRLPPVQRFADGGEAERMSAGAEIGSLFDAGNREIQSMGGLEQFGSGNYYSGEGSVGGSGGSIFGGGSSGLGFGADDGGNYAHTAPSIHSGYYQAGQSILDAFNVGNQAIEAMGGLEQFSDPNYYSGEGGYANPDDMLGPAPAPAPAPAVDIPEPGFTGIGANIMTQAGIGPAPGYNVGSMLGGLGLNAFDPTPVAQQNIDLAAAVPDRQSWDPFTSGPTSQFNQPFGSTLSDLAASTNLAQLGSPDDYEDAPDRGFRGMQLSNVAADDPFASFPTDDLTDRGFRGQPLEGQPVDNYVDRGLRGLPSEGPPVDTSMPDGMVGNAASSKASYTSDLVGPFSPQGVRNMAAVGQTEVDVIAREMARNIAREQGITVAQAMPDARAMALQHFTEVVQNRSASFGPKGFGGQTYSPTIEQVLEQRAAFSAVPNTQSRTDGRFPGRVEDLPVSPEYLAATDRVLAGIAAGRRDFPNATHFMNPDESSARAMNQWGTDFVRDPGTVKVAGPAGSSHYVGNPDGINVPRYETMPPSGAMPNNLPSSISANDRARGARRADADIPELNPFATEQSIISELFGINPAMAQPVTPAGTPAPPRDPSTIPEIDIWSGERAFGRAITDGIRSITGTRGDPTDPANAALPPDRAYDPFSAVDVRDTTSPNRGNGLVDGLVRAGPGIAASWPSDAMAGRYSELGNLGNQPLTASAYGSPGAPAMAGRNTELGGGLEPEVEVAEPDNQDPAARERAVAAGPMPDSNRYNVDPLTGRMYDNITGDRIINPTYISRGIDFALGPTPVGPFNGLLGLAGGVTGYPLSVGQLMALGRPGTPLENAGADGAGDRNGNYGSYGEGAAGRDPPGVQSAYRDPAAPVAGSPSGGGGALSTVAAALPTPVSLPSLRGRQYLGEDDDPRTYGMRAMRRYYGDA
jgi:hypothetical protein